MKQTITFILLMLICVCGYAQTIDPVLLEEMGQRTDDEKINVIIGSPFAKLLECLSAFRSKTAGIIVGGESVFFVYDQNTVYIRRAGRIALNSRIVLFLFDFLFRFDDDLNIAAD